MRVVKLGKKKIRTRELIEWKTNVPNGKNQLEFSKCEDLLNRLIDLQVLIGQGVSKYDGWVRVIRDLKTGNLKFLFKDEQEDWMVTVILEGYNLRCDDKKYIREEFFKSETYNLLEEQSAILTFFRKFPIGADWKKKAQDLIFV